MQSFSDHRNFYPRSYYSNDIEWRVSIVGSISVILSKKIDGQVLVEHTVRVDILTINKKSGKGSWDSVSLLIKCLQLFVRIIFKISFVICMVIQNLNQEALRELMYIFKILYTWDFF